MALSVFLNSFIEEFSFSPPKEIQSRFSLEIFPPKTLYFAEEGDGFITQGFFAANPVKRKEEIYMELMQNNLMGQGTKGSVIGLDENEKFLTLSFLFYYEWGYPLWKQTLEDFLNHWDYLEKFVLDKENEQSLYS